jgi:serine protease inhibitor
MRLHQLKITRQLALLTGILLLLGADHSPQDNLEIPDLSRRINAFTIDLLKNQAASADAPANAIISPQSLFHGMAMSYIASGGDTRKELARALHFPDDNKPLLKELTHLRTKLKTRNPRRNAPFTPTTPQQGTA